MSLYGIAGDRKGPSIIDTSLMFVAAKRIQDQDQGSPQCLKSMHGFTWWVIESSTSVDL